MRWLLSLPCYPLDSSYQVLTLTVPVRLWPQFLISHKPSWRHMANSIKHRSSSSTPAENLTVTFKDIQDLTVQAGTYQSLQNRLLNKCSRNPKLPLGNLNLIFAGQSYLEYGTCKQIQSNLQLTLQVGNNNDNMVDSFTSTLTQDQNP